MSGVYCYTHIIAGPEIASCWSATAAGSLLALKREGWVHVATEGSHHKLRHPERGVIVVPHPKKDLPTGTARSIAKAAGWVETGSKA